MGSGWKLVIDQDRKAYMQLCIDLYQNDMTAYVPTWSTTWYQAMSGPIPVIDSSTDAWDEEQMEDAAASGKTTEVFAYGLPSWGVLTMRDNVGDLAGNGEYVPDRQTDSVAVHSSELMQ